MVKRPLANGFQNAVSNSAVRKIVYRFAAEPQSVQTLMISIVDPAAFISTVAIFIKHEVEKSSLDKARKKKPLSKLAEAVVEKKIMIADEISTKRVNLVPPLRPATIISDNKNIRRRTIQQRPRMPRKSAVIKLIGS